MAYGMAWLGATPSTSFAILIFFIAPTTSLHPSIRHSTLALVPSCNEFCSGCHRVYCQRQLLHDMSWIHTPSELKFKVIESDKGGDKLCKFMQDVLCQQAPTAARQAAMMDPTLAPQSHLSNDPELVKLRDGFITNVVLEYSKSDRLTQ